VVLGVGMTFRRVFAIVTAVVAVAALVGGAVAYANADEGAGGDPSGATAGAADHRAHEGDESHEGHEGRNRRHGHRHPRLPAYDERYAAASGDEQAAADALRDDVAATLAKYADVDAAVADGYRAPRNPRSPRRHYLNRSLARDGEVLDPARPEGLVYYEVEGHEPVLLGAFFVAPPDVEAPRPAGDRVVWHSHDPACAAFFATADEPCTGSRRMLHVWTVESATDPFGTPIGAAFARGDRPGDRPG
jgi:hypothetical protein